MKHVDERWDIIVIGGGVIGLSIACALADKCSVLVLERHKRLGEELSTRNSGVIHAGLYYPPGSLKANHCVRGSRLLYAWCERHGVPHKRTSKLIVARHEAEVAWLYETLARGAACGVEGLRLVARAELEKREPALRGYAALHASTSGLVDAADFVRSLGFVCQTTGVDLALGTEATAFEHTGTHWKVGVHGPAGYEVVRAGHIINAAGLHAPNVTRKMHKVTPFHQRYVKGSYFRLRPTAPKPNTALVYPTPGQDGLGIHLTRELGGTWVAGPDAQAIEAPEFSVDTARAEAFARDLKTMLPGIERTHLEPHFASVRPKLGQAGEFEDFKILRELGHDATHLLGIESPGLTAALSLGSSVAELF